MMMKYLLTILVLLTLCFNIVEARNCRADDPVQEIVIGVPGMSEKNYNQVLETIYAAGFTVAGYCDVHKCFVVKSTANINADGLVKMISETGQQAFVKVGTSKDLIDMCEGKYKKLER